jgi:SAM-dependent methyltransferase
MKLSFVVAVIFVTNNFAQPNLSPERYIKYKQKKIDVILLAADFRAKDVVADVGSGNGWFDVALGIKTDSVDFYLEEIDSSFIKEGRLNEAVSAYSKIKTRPITCTYSQTIGTEKSTRLPTEYFDKVLLIDCFHHLTFRTEMLADLKRILKAGGKVVVFEAVARKPGQIFKPCNSIIFTREEIISSFARSGLRLDQVYKTVNGNGIRFRVFTFLKT